MMRPDFTRFECRQTTSNIKPVFKIENYGNFDVYYVMEDASGKTNAGFIKKKESTFQNMTHLIDAAENIPGFNAFAWNEIVEKSWESARSLASEMDRSL